MKLIIAASVLGGIILGLIIGILLFRWAVNSVLAKHLS